METDTGPERGNGHWNGDDTPPTPPSEPEDSAGSAFERSYIPQAPRKLGLKIDEDFIASVVDSSGGEHMVEKHHRAMFISVYGAALGKVRGAKRIAERYLASQKKVVAVDRRLLDGTTRFLTVWSGDPTNSPWTRGDRLAWLLLLVISAMALCLGINNVATYLIGSGFIVFAENHALAYLLSSVTIAIAFALKYGIALPATDRGRRTFRWTLWVIAMTFGVVWIVSFAMLFPHIQAESVGDIVNELTTGSRAGGARLENLFVGSQVFCEITIAALLFNWMSDISASHRSTVLPTNPAYAAYERALSADATELNKATKQLEEITGALEAYEALMNVFTSQAVAKWKSGTTRARHTPFSTDEECPE